MTINNTEKYTLFTAENNFNSFFDEVSNEIKNYKNNNIIIDVTNIDTDENKIKSLEIYAEIQMENNKSFVIILSNFDADDFDEELNVVPTLREAIDIIDMDEITRDLGF